MARYACARTPCALSSALSCALLIVVSCANPALAGTVKEGVYTSSHGYQITAPVGWTVVDRGNKTVHAADMPASLEKATEQTYDVLIFDPDLDAADTALTDNIIVVMTPAELKVSASTARRLAADTKPELAKFFATVDMVSAAAGKHGATDTIDIEWKVAGENGAKAGTILQSLFVTDGHSILVTCTIGEGREAERRPLCQAAFDSVKP